VSSEARFQRYMKAASDAGLTKEQFRQLVKAGIVLQPRQLLATAAAFQCDHEDGPTEIGYGGARSGGKSHWGLAQLALDCLRYPGLTALCLRKVGIANRENFNELRLKVLRNVKTTWKVAEGVLLFPNGSRIVLGHFQNEKDVDRYLGLEYDVILLEEATTLTTSKYKMIRTCNRTSKPGWRPRMYTTTNPGGVGHAWYKAALVAPHRKGGEMLPLHRQSGPTRFIPATAYDNGFVNREYVKTLEGLTGWMRKAWLLGDWDVAAGQFFTTWRSDIHVKSDKEMRSLWTPGYHRTWGSLDYGFTHYTTFYPMAEAEGAVLILGEHAERKKLPPWHAEAMEKLVERQGLLLGNLDAVVAGRDIFASKGSETARTIADQYAEQGWLFEAADDDRIGGAGEILYRLGDADAGLPPRLFVHESCVKLIECLPALEHDPAVPERTKKWDADEDGIGGDDPYDGARYGIMAATTRALPALAGGASQNTIAHFGKH
jgi:phage terminase large subunit